MFSFQVTIPLNPETLTSEQKVNLDDGRPKALQIETSEINIMSAPIGYLSNDTSFSNTLKSIKTGWLFSNAHANDFPHEADVDGDVVPSFMEKLLSTGFHSFVLAPGDAPSCEDVCYTSWNLVIHCVCVSFIHEMSELGVTHNTTPFVTDFPLNVWLFENLTNTQAKSFTPPSGKFKPKLHVVVDIPSAISAAIDHLELLFLMRLGDSLNNFQVMIEEIFSFKSSDECDTESTGGPSKRARSQSVIMARKKQQLTDVEFEFSGCILVKSFHFNASLPAKAKNKKDNHPAHNYPEVFTGSETTPTHQPKCKIYLKTPTIDESSELINSLPCGEPYASNVMSQRIATISGPISVSPDPGLQHALQKSLPGTPRVASPRSQSPSLASTDTPTTLSHSGSLASMNIDDATNQFSGYQDDDDFYVIEDKAVTRNLESRTTNESSNDMPSSSTHVPSDSNSSHQSTVQSQNYVPPAKLQNQAENGKEMMPESSVAIKFSNSYPNDDVTTWLTENLPTDSNTTLEDTIPEEGTLTVHDLNVSQGSLVPPAKEIRWQLQVSAFNICAIPIVNPTGFIAKLSAGRIDLKETPMTFSSTETLSQKDAKSGDTNESYDLHPSVRGRIELGPRIYKYYPTLEELHIPCVVQLHVNGINASLLLSLMENLALMFEDENKASIPVPLYIILEGNQFLIMESADGHAEDFSTLNVTVNKVCIQRGPEVSKLAVWKMELLGGETSSVGFRETTPVAGLGSSSSNTPIDSTKSDELDALLNSIRTFTLNLQPQIERLGSSLSQVQRINQAVLDLQDAVGIGNDQLDPPPRYSESVDHDNATTMITSLHEEIKSLQEVQKQLQDQITSNQKQLTAKDSEMAQLVGELVKSKDSEVAMKEVVFRLNNQIQDVVMENDQLKVTMARAGLRVPVSKRL